MHGQLAGIKNIYSADSLRLEGGKSYPRKLARTCQGETSATTRPRSPMMTPATPRVARRQRLRHHARREDWVDSVLYSKARRFYPYPDGIVTRIPVIRNALRNTGTRLNPVAVAINFPRPSVQVWGTASGHPKNPRAARTGHY